MCLQDSSTSKDQQGKEVDVGREQETVDLQETRGTGPVTIYLEGEPTLTRCQLLQQHLQESNSLKYVAQCDNEGRFIPTQCYTPSVSLEGQLEEPKCWCVDETGHKTQPTAYFTRGERQCGKLVACYPLLRQRARESQLAAQAVAPGLTAQFMTCALPIVFVHHIPQQPLAATEGIERRSVQPLSITSVQAPWF